MSLRKSLGAAALATFASCSAPAAGGSVPALPVEPRESAEFFAAAVAHVAGVVQGRVRVDPRPLRPGADLAGIGEDDLMPGATGVTRLRSEVLTARAVPQTDAPADFRCTFSSGIRMPADTARTQAPDDACRDRQPCTTLIFGVPAPATEGDHPQGTWRMEAVSMDTSGFRVWDLLLRAGADGGWRVVAADARFSIWS